MWNFALLCSTCLVQCMQLTLLCAKKCTALRQYHKAITLSVVFEGPSDEEEILLLLLFFIFFSQAILSMSAIHPFH